MVFSEETRSILGLEEKDSLVVILRAQTYWLSFSKAREDVGALSATLGGVPTYRFGRDGARKGALIAGNFLSRFCWYRS